MDNKHVYMYRKTVMPGYCLVLLLCLSAYGGHFAGPVGGAIEPKQAAQIPTPTETHKPSTGIIPILPTLQPKAHPTKGTTPGATPTQNPQPVGGGVNSGSGSSKAIRPLLAFYYPWYTPTTWCSCHMPDLPPIKYNSSDDATIDQQVTEAADAGITGFISSWWGIGDVTDTNFSKLLTHAAALESRTGSHFTSTIYFESDAPSLSGTTNIVTALNYVATHYSNDPHFLHWQGKPVFFFWNPLGGGRTLAQWASIRSQVDPNNQMIWSAEGVSMSLLSVFDGIHLFSGGYWGIQHGNMPAVDQGFRSQIDAYNAANHTYKIWAAGVIPGYNDTLVPGRTGTYIVPRNNGATYQQSWTAALSSQPDWVTITSFNEWFEGAMIEPSVTYGNQYLTLTQQYAKQLHS
ncbi:MAG: hypothetical protein NVS2B2_02570 [Ktedonobacteraceae bacterium]